MHRRSRFRPAAAGSAPASSAATQAQLADAYGLQWSVQSGTRPPSVGHDADYVHHVADLLSGGDDAAIPRGDGVRILDIDTGAGCVRPLVGASDYGWRFVATDRDQAAHRWGRQIVRINRAVARLIEGRHQPDPVACLAHVTTTGERFAACLYAPGVDGDAAPEAALVEQLIAESATRPALCAWFTAVVSTRAAAKRLGGVLARTAVADVREVAVTTGKTRRYLLAWTYARPGS